MYAHLFPEQRKMSINLMSKKKNEEEGATMLTNRCLARTYVIYKVSYALLQLRQLAYKLSLSLSGHQPVLNTLAPCSCSSSSILASAGLYFHGEEER